METLSPCSHVATKAIAQVKCFIKYGWILCALAIFSYKIRKSWLHLLLEFNEVILEEKLEGN